VGCNTGKEKGRYRRGNPPLKTGKILKIHLRKGKITNRLGGGAQCFKNEQIEGAGQGPIEEETMWTGEEGPSKQERGKKGKGLDNW